MKYQVYNLKTRMFVGKPYACRKRARRRADVLDLEYGAYAYTVKEVMCEL